MIWRPSTFQSHDHPRRGFSLTELAIVLMVGAVLITGVWLVASRAWHTSGREQTKEDVALAVDGVRAFYSGQPGVPSASAATITDTLIQASALPNHLVRPTKCGGLFCADQSGNAKVGGAVSATGTFLVCSSTPNGACAAPSGASSFFGIRLDGLERSECVALVKFASGSSGPKGLTGIDVNGTPSGPMLGNDDATLQTNCGFKPDNSINITLIYGIQPPTF